MTKENKGKEYEPGTLQTYCNGLRKYFLERPCPPAVDNFNLEISSAIEFEEVSMMPSMKKKDLKQKGLVLIPECLKFSFCLSISVNATFCQVV